MWISAIANYRGGLAHYKVVPDEENIYNAYLERYDGRPDHAPPASFILVRGAHRWSGSISNPGLLEEVGKVIDRRIRGRLYTEIWNKTPNQRGRRR